MNLLKNMIKSLQILSAFKYFQIGEITESPDTEYMSTSAILHYCKSKVGRLIIIIFTKDVINTIT